MSLYFICDKNAIFSKLERILFSENYNARKYLCLAYYEDPTFQDTPWPLRGCNNWYGTAGCNNWKWPLSYFIDSVKDLQKWVSYILQLFLYLYLYNTDKLWDKSWSLAVYMIGSQWGSQPLVRRRHFALVGTMQKSLKHELWSIKDHLCYLCLISTMLEALSPTQDVAGSSTAILLILKRFFNWVRWIQWIYLGKTRMAQFRKFTGKLVMGRGMCHPMWG